LKLGGETSLILQAMNKLIDA